MPVQTEVKQSHKELRAERQFSADVFTRWARMHDLKFDFDPTTEGGFLWDGKEAPVGFVRSPLWRNERDTPSLGKADIRTLATESKQKVNIRNIQSGGELELYVWDPLMGRLAPVMSNASPVPQRLEDINSGIGFEEEDFLDEPMSPDAKLIGYSPELAEGCIELNFHHSANTQENALASARAMKQLAHVVEEQGWLLTPIAAIPHKPLELDETNKHPYVQRIAMEFMKWENVRHFIGASWQIHVEMIDLQSGLKAVNLYQQVSPLLYALSLAGPFLHGQVNPNLAHIYREDDNNRERLDDDETYEHLNETDWLSVRGPSRWRGSPSGGTFIEPLPETPSEFYLQAERGLKNNDPDSPNSIPSPARAAGHHRDRVRIDIKPQGTIEISNLDTFGGHFLKLAAMQEFTRVLVWKLQLYAKADGLGQLSKDYPSLFSYPVTHDSLRNAHFANIKVAKEGSAAIIRDEQGNERSVEDLFHELIAFVNEPIEDDVNGIHYVGLPNGILSELKKSTMVPGHELLSEYTDEYGFTSVSGFYKTGIDTLAHWLKARAQQLIERGYSDKKTIALCMNDLGTSFHEFLRATNGKEVAALFS